MADLPTGNYTATLAGTTWTVFSVNTQADGLEPAKPPKGLIVTRAVQTKAGWCGQILVDREIVRETVPHEDSRDALEEVNEFVVKRIKRLFA